MGKKVQVKNNENLQKPGVQGKVAKAPSSLISFKKKVLSACTRLIVIAITIGFFVAVGVLMHKNHAYITEWFGNSWCKPYFERLSAYAKSDDVSSEISKKLHIVQTFLQGAIQTVSQQLGKTSWKDIAMVRYM